MGKQFKTVAIVGRHEDPRVAEPMTTLVAHLTKSGVDVIAGKEMSLSLDIKRVPEQELAAAADLIIAVGGDGTILYAAKLARNTNVPLFGINRGRLGFLADVTPDEMIKSADLVLSGNFTRDSRLMLDVNLVKADGQEVTATALNDVVLQRRETGRMVDFETRVGDHFVNSHSGDGLIVATPTGSTAYALSCGGPIIEPQLDAFVVVPICPHTLTDRPIVLSANQPVEVRVLERDETKAEITADGRSVGSIRPEDKLIIGPSDDRVMLIHPPNYDFYSILRSKLFWGQDNRTRAQSREARDKC